MENITAAALFRTVEKARPTLILDEADTFISESEELRGILNSGHSHGGEVIRTVGDDFEPRLFSTWAPVAIAAIGKIPRTLEDRSIRIEMKRRARGETVEPWRADRAHLLLGDVHRKCVRWAQDHLDDLRQADPAVPDHLHDRARDNWRPLLAIADAAGGAWPERARDAAKTLSAGGDDADSRRTMLLADIRTIFAARKKDDWIPTAEIIGTLIDMSERPWATIRRGDKPITVQGLRSLLEPFKVFSSHNPQKTMRGYGRDGFADAWARYLPPDPPPGGVDPSIRPKPGNDAASSPDHIRPDEDVPDGCASAANPHDDCDPDGWTDRTPPKRTGTRRFGCERPSRCCARLPPPASPFASSRARAKVEGKPEPKLLARLRETKAAIVEILTATRCRLCGERLRWPGPVGVTYADGMAECQPCADQEVGRIVAAAERPGLPSRAARTTSDPHPSRRDRGRGAPHRGAEPRTDLAV